MAVEIVVIDVMTHCGLLLSKCYCFSGVTCALHLYVRTWWQQVYPNLVTIHRTVQCHGAEYQNFEMAVTDCIKKFTDKYSFTFNESIHFTWCV
jgi:hypothetical protein